MTHDYDQGYMQVFGGIFNAAEDGLVRNGPCDPDDKEIAEALTEDGFGRHA
jgi:hypothetical protein